MNSLEVVAEVERLIRAEAELERVKAENQVLRDGIAGYRNRAESAEQALAQERTRNEVQQRMNVADSFEGWMLSGDLAGSPIPPYEFGDGLPRFLFGVIDSFVTRPHPEGITLNLKHKDALPPGDLAGQLPN